MHNTKRACMALGAMLCVVLSFSVSYRYFFVHRWSPARRLEDKNWIATSGSWIDRQLCTWFGACGISHLNSAHWVTHEEMLRAAATETSGHNDVTSTHPFWLDGKENPKNWTDEEKRYAVYPNLYWSQTRTGFNLSNLDSLKEWNYNVFLHSEDNVENQPDWLLGRKNIPQGSNEPLLRKESVKVLRRRGFAGLDGEETALDPTDSGMALDAIVPVPESDNLAPPPGNNSNAGPESWTDRTHHNQQPLKPKAEEAEKSLGDDDDDDDNAAAADDAQTSLRKVHQGGRSGAPVILITVDKGNGILDAFYFYFYSFNLGNSVLGIRFGNHVGDWEHNAIRFVNGVPKAIFFSQHAHGAAYTWDAVEKIGKRPVVYSASGSHANYPTPGLHAYILPFSLLFDSTDARGPLWDPVLNLQSYTYNPATDTLLSSTLTPKAPTQWFYYTGHWGDGVYPLSDARQYRIAGEFHYSSGPMGPRFKGLGRSEICAGRGVCRPRMEM